MRIFTKKAFIFFNRSEDDKAIVTKALAFDDVPEWVNKDATFKAALADGDIEVIVTREQQIKAEKGIVDVKHSAPAEEEPEEAPAKETKKTTKK